MKRRLIAVAVLAVVLGGIFGGRAYLDGRAAAAAAGRGYPAATVATAMAQHASWDSEVRVVGTLRAVEGTDITAQIAGNVSQIAFESGARVRKGQLLVQLDNSTQMASLDSNQARLEQAARDLARMQNLYPDQAVSQQELQAAETNHSVAAAAVSSDRAALAKLRITAPFSGVLGIREVSLGQYVSPGTGIVNLQRWDPVLLDFTLPQNMLDQIRPGQKVTFAVDAYPDRIFAGEVTAIGAQIDPETRNLAVQATLTNADERLRPGLFGHVTLALGRALTGVTVPHTAITYSTFGDTVYVVSSGDGGRRIAHARVVHVLAERDGKAMLNADDLQAGSVVVTAGQHKLRDGVPVMIDNSVQP